MGTSPVVYGGNPDDHRCRDRPRQLGGDGHRLRPHRHRLHLPSARRGASISGHVRRSVSRLRRRHEALHPVCYLALMTLTQSDAPGLSTTVPVIDWLLDADPSIRWQVMRDLTDAPNEVVAAERS